MYIKRLVIESKRSIIRDIQFKNGLNLIVDDTPEKLETKTGNNVGKTTVLKLIDFCLGSKQNNIIKDNESKKKLKNIEDFLINEEIIITLILSNDLLIGGSDIVIRRNFLNSNKKILEVNGRKFKILDEFLEFLNSLLFGERNEKKPTMRQIISHNIRYSDERISNTLKTLDRSPRVEYESLFLFMFGFKPMDDRTNLFKKLKLEKNFKSKLIEDKGKTELQLSLNIVEENIKKLNFEKDKLIVDEDYENKIEKSNFYKNEISRVHTEISELEFKKELLLETKQNFESNYSNIDIQLLRNVYEQYTKYNVDNVQKDFNKSVQYYNSMIIQQIKFVTEDIPKIDNEVQLLRKNLNRLILDKKELDKIIKVNSNLEDLNYIINKLAEKNKEMGEIETLISQIDDVDNKILNLNKELENIENKLFNEVFEKELFEMLDKFNKYFSNISKELYDEEYGITYNIVTDSLTKMKFYEFSCFNNNASSGKKQGEIICFDLAYILFARDNGIPHVNFILNDKKELMYDAQLINVCKFAEKNNIQVVFSILRDKLPNDLNDDDNIIVQLSQEDKLFRIEKNYKN